MDKALSLIGKKFKELNLTNIYAPPLPSLALPSLPMTSWVSMPLPPGQPQMEAPEAVGKEGLGHTEAFACHLRPAVSSAFSSLGWAGDQGAVGSQRPLSPCLEGPLSPPLPPGQSVLKALA